ncbi:MAG: site-specific integrase [Acidimicrobiia bacterium]|nr:site-specific integrase [Acidimicrobiia bacterium]
MPRKGPGVYRAKNGTWFFRVNTTAPNGEKVETSRRGFATSSDAQRARRQFLDEIERRDPVVNGRGLTVSQLVGEYLDEAESLHRLGPKTLFDYRNYAQSYIDPHIGDVLASALTPAAVSEWQLALATGGAVKTGRALAPGTIRLARAPLNGAFRYGMVKGLVKSNPVPEVKPPPRKKSKPAHWTPDQARSFLALHEGDRLLPLWSFLLGSGLRIGELVWLQWSQVDLDDMRVRVDNFATTLGYEVVGSGGKSTDATRTLELDHHLAQVLDDQRRVQEKDQANTVDFERSSFVFTKPGGGPYHPQYLSKLLAKVSTEIGLPRLTAHGLRHTCATLMLVRGIPPKVAAERLGHADPSLFLNLYSHVGPTMQSRAALEIGDALFGEPQA